MTRERKGWMSMTKFSLAILTVLNDNNVETPSNALSVSQIIELMGEKRRKSYSTTFRHLLNMAEENARINLENELEITIKKEKFIITRVF